MDARTLARARVWFATFGIEQIAAALLDERSDKEINVTILRAEQWVRDTLQR